MELTESAHEEATMASKLTEIILGEKLVRVKVIFFVNLNVLFA